MKEESLAISPPVGHILVVDDIEMNRDLLARRLARRGMTVSLASSGPEALKMVSDNDYDLMLLDIAMPQMNGLDVLRRLREEKSDAELPVIMVTARTDSKDVVEALKSGANDYVTKPIDFPVLLARSRTQLSRRQAMASLHESEERYALAMRGSSAGLWDWDLTGDSMFYSARWKAMLGHSVDEISDDPKEWWSRVHDDDSVLLQETLGQHLRQESLQFECEYRLRHKDGSYRWMMGRGIAIRDQNGQASRVTGSQLDTTEAKTIDALTSLPNRTFFVDQLQRALKRRSKNDESSFVVIFLDVDRFKLVNDSMGHDVGDEFLCQVGMRIDAAVSGPQYTNERTRPILARMGGDEFAVLLTDVASKGVSVDLAESILQAFEDPFDMRGQAVVASSSIGIVVAGETHSSSEDLLRDADNAMYQAKAAGGGSFVEFDKQMHELAVARLRMESDLRVCLDEQQLAVYYQPIIDIASSNVVGFEALVRWIHPDKGFISPVDFIPVAEETGMIDRIGRYVFKESVEQLSEWRRSMPEDATLTVAVNLSRRQFIHRDLAEFLDKTLKQAGLDSKHIKLEITESTVLGDEELVQHAITSLKALGIQLSMDDFGTGYSSLSLLHHLPFDVLKVDRSFISRIDEDARLVNTIIQLAGNFGLQVVAEGVETEEQLNVLRTMGCDFAQGYYFSRPLPADQATKMLQNRGMVSDC